MSEKPQRRRATKPLIEHAFALARELEATTLLVEADPLRGVKTVQNTRDEERVVWLVRGDRDPPLEMGKRDRLVRMPELGLTRLSRRHLGLFLAVIQGHVEQDERVVLLMGSRGSRSLDTLTIAEPPDELRWLHSGRWPSSKEPVALQTLARVIELALRFSSEGREGRAIGTLFVVGSQERLARHMRQLILNPMRGHLRRERNIQRPELTETLRELSALDGAFVISSRGVVETAGTYVDARAKNVRLQPGQGSRHAAAAAITSVAPAVAVVLSESSGTVTVFHDGQMVLQLETAQRSGQRSRATSKD